MIFNQSVHWAIYNVAYRQTEAFGSLLDLLTEMDADVAYYVYG